jgi:NTE family protein
MMKYFLSILLLLCTLLGSSQKVGLVLSGGGAKGLSHIGLIKVLEENEIPIDYVTGTSIGAIIAGLYASGMSPDEMLELFNSDDFKLWSTGRMDKDDLYYFKRNDELPDWLKLDITRREEKVRLVLPINIVPERQMDFAFMQLTAQTTAVCRGDFDNLMVPFRCVSTDIYNNRAVIHKQGDLGEAIRASMTFPMVYKPIEKDGMLLFDGGIVNNFPVDVMMDDFSPDIIIGHKVSEVGGKPDPDDIFSQIEAMVTQITRYEVPDSIGVMLETKLNDVSLLDFHKVNYIYRRGIFTGEQFIDSLKMRIDRRVPAGVVENKRKQFVGKKPELNFNNIQVEGIQDNSQRKYIIESIKFREKVIHIDELRTSYFKLIADEQIKSIQPKAFYNLQTGYFDLHLKVEPRKPFDIEIGGHISTRSNTYGFLQANYKGFNNLSYKVSTNVFFGRFYSSFMLGGRIDSPTRNPFYVSTYFTYNMWDYFTTSSDLIFTDIRPSYMRQLENNIRVEMGIPYTKTGLVDFGISFSNSNDEYYQTRVFNYGDKFDNTKFRSFNAHVRIDKLNYDFKQYPTEGGRKMFSMHYINGIEMFLPGSTAPISKKTEQTHSYFQIRAIYDQYYSLNNYFKAGVLGEAVFNNNMLFSNYTSTILSAPFFSPTPNSKSIFNENYRANQYFAIGGKLIYRFNQNLHLRTEAYGFFPIQTIKLGSDNTVSYSDKIFNSAHIMGLGALVYQTRLGPIGVEMNYYEKPGQKWFFAVNMGYMLFNKRGF